VPKHIRAITIIKAGGDLSKGRIKGAVAPDEVISLSDDSGRGFIDCDPREGFSVRNFHIQTAKLAQVSDIVIYGDANTDHRIIKSVAERTTLVQKRWRKDMENSGQVPETYSTFVLTDPFPEHVVVDSHGVPTGEIVDFLQQERKEMCTMSKASEISKGVFQGPSPDMYTIPDKNTGESLFDLYIEANDHAGMPDTTTLAVALKNMENHDDGPPEHITSFMVADGSRWNSTNMPMVISPDP
jgi:dual specificity MAP kinase phosphatase